MILILDLICLQHSNYRVLTTSSENCHEPLNQKNKHNVTNTDENSLDTTKNIIYLDVSTSTGSFLGTATTYCAKNRMKKWYFHSSDEDFRCKSKRQGR